MSRYQVMPPLTDEELADLRADIAAHGVRVPIDVDEEGNVLDGHHRLEIAEALGLACPSRVLADLTEDEKVAHAYAVNLQRRSLTRDAKRALVAASLARDPELSDRQHAERTGVSPTTAGAVRSEMEDDGRLSKLDSRTGADGRQRPAQQPTRPAEWTCPDCGGAFKVEHTHCDTCDDHHPAPEVCTAHHDIVNVETGEIVAAAPAVKPTPRAAEDKPGPLVIASDILARLTALSSRIEFDHDALAAGIAEAEPSIRAGWLNDIARVSDRLTDLHRELTALPMLRRIK